MSENSRVKNPDYHLRLSGDQTAAALQKIIEADLSGLGIYKLITSTADSPANLNGIKDIGNYQIEYVTGATVPEELINSTPVMVSCTNVNGILVKVASVAENRYMSWSEDAGETWSAWVRKVDNATKFPPEVDSEGNPIQGMTVEEMQEKIEQISQMLGLAGEGAKGAAVFGTTEEADAILAGTYDFDQTPVTPDPEPEPAPDPGPETPPVEESDPENPTE